jgi:hypothetical protein
MECIGLFSNTHLLLGFGKNAFRISVGIGGHAGGTGGRLN